MKKSWSLVCAALITLTAAFFVSCSQDDEVGVGTNYAGTYHGKATTTDGGTFRDVQLKVEGAGGTSDSTWGLYSMTDSGYETDPFLSGTWEAHGDSTIKASLTIQADESTSTEEQAVTFNFVLYSQEQTITRTVEGETANIRYTFDYSDVPDNDALSNYPYYFITPWNELMS